MPRRDTDEVKREEINRLLAESAELRATSDRLAAEIERLRQKMGDDGTAPPERRRAGRKKGK